MSAPLDKALREKYAALIREASFPLEIVLPELPPSLEELVYPGAAGPLEGIRALLLDVYGTLFASAAGEIGAEACTGEGERGRYFIRAVLDARERLYAKTAYPEIRVEELWAAFPGRKGEGRPQDPRELALRYELSVNPVFPMPGAGELFAALRGSPLSLGLISNAQFFTPLLFDAFFGSSPQDLGFDPRLLIYSFEEGEAKPSPRLFSKAAAVLASRGIAPEAVLYVGNDMHNDILPAAGAGFKTALFAGDRRSLRLRDFSPPAAGALSSGPSRVIRDLSCIPPLLSLPLGKPGASL